MCVTIATGNGLPLTPSPACRPGRAHPSPPPSGNSPRSPPSRTRPLAPTSGGGAEVSLTRLTTPDACHNRQGDYRPADILLWRAAMTNELHYPPRTASAPRFDWRLSLLGAWSLATNEGPIEVGRNAQRLFALLGTHGPCDRAYVAGVLWPQCSDIHANGNLR